MEELGKGRFLLSPRRVLQSRLPENEVEVSRLLIVLRYLISGHLLHIKHPLWKGQYRILTLKQPRADPIKWMKRFDMTLSKAVIIPCSQTLYTVYVGNSNSSGYTHYRGCNNKVATTLQGCQIVTLRWCNLVTTLCQTGCQVLRLSQGCDKVVTNLHGCNKQVTTRSQRVTTT